VTTTAEDNSVTGSVTSSDVDGGTPNYSVSGNPANGSVTMNPDGTYTYTPNANFNGSDSFDYTVNDGKGGVDTATVNINVTAVNDAPVAASATFTGLEDAAAISGTLTATDVDSGDTQTFTLGSNPSNGNVTLNANGTFDYVPNANFNGTDSFQYIVTDAAGATSIATATVTVTAVDDAPVAADSFAAADEGDAVITGAVSATDIDSASITFAVVGTAPAGLAFNNNGTFSFNPSNPAYNSLAAGQVQTLTVNFTATATGQSDAGVLTITVTGTNDAPVASAERQPAQRMAAQ
jgi:VCBS repeat-containing protein